MAITISLLLQILLATHLIASSKIIIFLVYFSFNSKTIWSIVLTKWVKKSYFVSDSTKTIRLFDLDFSGAIVGPDFALINYHRT